MTKKNRHQQWGIGKHFFCLVSFRVISFELAKTDIKQSNYALQTLLAIVMSVQNCKSYAERERVLLSKILDPKMRQNLFLLNDILLVKVGGISERSFSESYCSVS